MNQTTFVVSRFENRNGVTSWRVDGRIHGLRIRKNFKTREEAAAEQAVLELKSLQAASGLRPVMSSLTEDQVREAESLFRRVAGRSLPLSAYVDFALANYREPEKQKRLADAITEYVAAKKHEHEQDLLSISQFVRIVRDLKRLQRHFPDASVADIGIWQRQKSIELRLAVWPLVSGSRHYDTAGPYVQSDWLRIFLFHVTHEPIS